MLRHARPWSRARSPLAAGAAAFCAAGVWAQAGSVLPASVPLGAPPAADRAPGVVSVKSSPPVRRPIAAGRVVRAFDFEEQRLNDTPIPLYWHVSLHDPPRRDRPGFPIWNLPALDYTVAHGGEGSVRLTVKGGSAALALDSGVVPVFAGADYRVTARVRTSGLENARAGLVVCFLDERLRPIEDSTRRSPLVISEEGWTTIEARAPGAFDHAAYLQIEVQLLQAREFAPLTMGAHEIHAEDLAGQAWFDDIQIVQAARVEARPVVPSGVFAGEAAPGISIFVKDLTGEPMDATLHAFDTAGHEVLRHSIAIDPGGVQTTWSPDLPAFGWYRVVLDVDAAGVPVGTSQCDLAWLSRPEPMRPGSESDAALGVMLAVPSARFDAEVPAVLRSMRLRRATLPIDLGADAASSIARLSPLVSALLAQWCDLTLALPAGAASDAPEAGEWWTTFGRPVVERFSQRVARWAIGEPSLDDAVWLSSGPGLATGEARVRAAAPSPTIIIPWDAWTAPRESLGARHVLTIALPGALPGEHLPEVVRSWLGVGESGATFVLHALDPGLFGTHESAADLARRAVFAWSALDDTPRSQGLTLAFAQPWRESPSGVLEPSADLPVIRTLSEQLEGRRVVAWMTMDRGVRCAILAPARENPSRRGPALVAWNERSTRPFIELALSRSEVRLTDIRGNVSTLSPTVDARTRAISHRLPISDEPVFVEDVDLELLLLQASFRFDPPSLPSMNRPVDRRIGFDNPWNSAITGRYFIISPGTINDELDPTWDISPRSGFFNVPARGRLDAPVALAFSPLEAAGTREVVVDIELSAEEEYGVIRLRAAAELGVEDFTVDLSLKRSPTTTGPDATFEVTVTNLAAEPMDLQVIVFAGDAIGRRTSSISNLEPGHDAMRRFPFPGFAASLRGQTVYVSVLDRATGARLNTSLKVE